MMMMISTCYYFWSALGVNREAIYIRTAQHWDTDAVYTKAGYFKKYRQYK